jgi:hypothetical protein
MKSRAKDKDALYNEVLADAVKRLNDVYCRDCTLEHVLVSTADLKLILQELDCLRDCIDKQVY